VRVVFPGWGEGGLRTCRCENIPASTAQNYRGGLSRTALLERCRALRRNETDAERLLWLLLRGRQVAGAKLRRQHQFGPFILDFFCSEHRLAIEVDGSQHFSDDGVARDQSRTVWLRRAGIRVLRFDNRQILLETEGVVETILNELGTNVIPSPQPSPRGRGSSSRERGG
jgi:very-short-patch-repair endonuclease